jgi:hypothetical protein
MLVIQRFKLLLLSFIILSDVAIAQDLNNEVPVPTNQLNKEGKREGLWYFSKPARMGEPSTLEFGNYSSGKRNGIWCKMEKYTEKFINIETYKDGMLNGEVKYFEDGKLYCIGNYLALNPQYKYDTFLIVDPVTQLERFKAVPTESGSIRHGYWRYYNTDSGYLYREEEYVGDDLVYSKNFKNLPKATLTENSNNSPKLPHQKHSRYKPPIGKRSFTE